MRSRIQAWLDSFGSDVMLLGWCDQYGVSIPPAVCGERLDAEAAVDSPALRAPQPSH